MAELRPNPLDAAHRRARSLWDWALLSPILYLFIAWGIQALGWLDSMVAASARVGAAALSAILGAAFVALAVVLVWVRGRRTGLVDRWREDIDLALSRWMFNFYVTAILADAMAFMGLVSFLVLGRPWLLLAGGAAAYIGYALAFPRRRDLKPLEPI